MNHIEMISINQTFQEQSHKAFNLAPRLPFILKELWFKLDPDTEKLLTDHKPSYDFEQFSKQQVPPKQGQSFTEQSHFKESMRLFLQN